VTKINLTFHSNFKLLQFALLSNSSSFILTALSLRVWQGSSWSDMSAFSGETTTMGSMADVSAFVFVQQAQQSDKRFPVPVWQARKRVSPVHKMKQDLELLVTLFYYLFIV